MPRATVTFMTLLGIEEEFLLVDHDALFPVAPTKHQTAALQRISVAGGEATLEWLRCQIEHASAVFNDTQTATEALLAFRKELAAVTRQFNIAAVPVGAAPRIDGRGASISDAERYLQLAELAPGIAADQYINGMHVHVMIPDPETGVQALNGLRPWLPLLAALSANSPFWQGRDSGFASWRTIHYRRWMVSGMPPHFADFNDYASRIEALLASDVVTDHGGICWLARLSNHYPTIEVRACDVQLQVSDAVVLAALIRGLVSAAIEQPPRSQPQVELLDVSLWQAAKFGLTGRLLDPFGGTPHPAEELVWKAFQHALPHLEAFGDDELVRTGLQLFLTEGTGATRQRAVYQREGIPGVLRYAAEASTSRQRHVPGAHKAKTSR